MIRALELVLFLLPLLAFVAWRVAAARGFEGPTPPQLVLAFAVLAVLAATLSVVARREALPEGRYVPAANRDGRIVPGHVE